MKLWCNKFNCIRRRLNPVPHCMQSVALSTTPPNTNTNNVIDTEVFTPGTIPRLNLGQYPG